MHRLGRALVPAALALIMVGCASGEATTPASPLLTPAPSLADRSAEASPASHSAAATASPTASAGAPSDALLAAVLTDVRSGESFTLAELAKDGPVLLEPMAVWCSNCRAQQHEVKRAHETASFLSVSLDVDLSESPEDLASYAVREGFDWHFAMADAALYRLLQERFGVAATNPPSTPLIVVEPEGTVRPLEFGRGTRSADELIAELGAG